MDRGRQRGFSDFLVIENKIEGGIIEVISIKVAPKFKAAVKIAGLHSAEIPVIYYAYKHNLIAFLDDDAARVFAEGIGIEYKGALGLLIDSLYEQNISHQEALNGLNKLAQIMYLSSEVYQFILDKINSFKDEL